MNVNQFTTPVTNPEEQSEFNSTDQKINPSAENEVRVHRKPRKTTRKVQEFLGGDYLSKDRVIGNIPFVFYAAFLAIIYIGNTYYAEKTYKDIERTKSELKELRYQYITTKSVLMFQCRQSEISKRAVLYGLQQTTIPPYKILYSGDSATGSNRTAE